MLPAPADWLRGVTKTRRVDARCKRLAARADITSREARSDDNTRLGEATSEAGARFNETTSEAGAGFSEATSEARTGSNEARVRADKTGTVSPGTLRHCGNRSQRSYQRHGH